MLVFVITLQCKKKIFKEDWKIFVNLLRLPAEESRISEMKRSGYCNHRQD
jgi:hypothetical protein